MTDSSSTPNVPMRPRRWELVTYAIASVAMAVLLVVCLFVRGPDHPVYGLLVASWTLVLGPLLADPVARRVPRHWLRVPARESLLHKMLGVAGFRAILQYSGWETRVHKRQFKATQAGLLALDVALRANACAHGSCFVIHLLVASVSLTAGHPWGALWILLPGLIVHLYPVLLQRSIMLRLQPLLDRHPRTPATHHQPPASLHLDAGDIRRDMEVGRDDRRGHGGRGDGGARRSGPTDPE